jgi:glycosyltransferase involved in cell wall biosynthesis
MRVLHITNWYPNSHNPKEAPWLKSHIDSLNLYVSRQSVFHLDISTGSFTLKFGSGDSLSWFILKFPGMLWRISEMMSAIFLFAYLMFNRANKNYDIINFHIAYPNLTYWHKIKNWIRIPVIITEHWSAYHYNFGVKQKLPRIQRIFRQQIPVFTVSRALATDIEMFSGAKFPSYVVPNIVDSTVFRNSGASGNRKRQQFFMVSQWKKPKEPFVVIEAFKRLSDRFPKVTLRIGGYGPLLEEMKAQCLPCTNISFLGALDRTEVATEMRHAGAFLHSSGYETFSVVCAEAITVGCPVIASAVGGIPEFVNERNGLLVEHNTVENFYEAMIQSLENPLNVSEIPDFSVDAIGKLYFDVLKIIQNDTRK